MLNELFEDFVEQRDPNNLKILPISVLDIGAQGKRTSNAVTDSSRSEYSPFPTEVSDLCFQYFLRDCKTIFDPFAGWGDRAEKAKEWNKPYFGYDTSQVAIDMAKSRGCDNFLADSRTSMLPKYDGVITCPPYWNLEVYSGDGIDKHKTWEEFLEDYFQIWKRVYNGADGGATFCVMVGEWRSNHRMYDLEYQTRKVFDECGAQLFDQVVVSRKKVSKINIMLPQAKRLGYTVRVHESLLVFKKPV